MLDGYMRVSSNAAGGMHDQYFYEGRAADS
jgi:hypothetical protein